MAQRFYFLYYQALTESLDVTEVSKHKFENTRGYEDLSRPNSIPRPARAIMSEMSRQDPNAAYRLFVTR